MRVVRAWVDDLPLRMQSTLLLSMRGPDGCAKEASAKVLVRELRYVVLHPAFPKELYPNKAEDVFMGTQTGLCSWSVVEHFKEHHDEYPHHWLMHFIHAAEIVGQFHPADDVRAFWWSTYAAMCSAMHMQPEDIEQLSRRLRDPAWISEHAAALAGARAQE